MAISAVPDYNALVQDYTIEPSGSGGSFVLTSFTIAGTAPIRINGGASADMSTSPTTISANTFGAAQAGVVPLSGGGTTNFLRADGTWAVPAGSGGYTTIAEETVSVTQRGLMRFFGPHVAVADNSGSSSTDITIPQFTSVDGGTVPASGGGTTNFLRADGTWVPPSGAYIQLQGSEPGTTQSGYGHIGNRMYADTGFVSGTVAPDITPKLFLQDTISASSTTTAALTRTSNDATGPVLTLRKARGIVGSLQATLADDLMASVRVAGVTTGLAFTDFPLAIVSADGNASGTAQPTYADLFGGSSAGYTRARLSSGGMIVGDQAGISTATRALSRFEVKGSFALRATAVTAGTFSPTAIHQTLMCDASGVALQSVTLPDPTTCSGRRYSILKVDSSNKQVDISTAAGNISGLSNWRLLQQGDAITVASDGTNWHIVNASNWRDQSSSASDSAALADDVTETTIADFNAGNVGLRNGAVYHVRCAGKFSTTGTPTLRFKIKNQSLDVLGDSGAITTPSGVTNAVWQIEFEMVGRDFTTPRINKAVLLLGQATGPGGLMNTYNMIDPTVLTLGGGVIPDKITAQWGTASASNTLTRYGWTYSVTPGTALV